QFQIEGVDGAASILFQIPNTNGWKQIDTTFTTGATVTTGKGIYFNSCTNAPLITDTCFIDNYELYNITGLSTGINKLMTNNVNSFVRNNKVVSSFTLDVATVVSVSLYNVNGTLIESNKSMGQSGKNERVLNAVLPSGVYVVKTTINGKFTINKIIL
ncbi:MAG: T9SS type A sorting domain-containing protein, partial [Paludibacter sp.]|nr:T9SS type A sorting domain-containing protein [Paludibacter sp.]